MPELPEVETTLRGIEPHLVGKRIHEVIVRESRLRQPVPSSLGEITGARVVSISRRAKYLLVRLSASHGHLLIHLGMSGSLRLSDPADAFRTHDHVALSVDSGRQLRYHDPRRFGLVLHLQHGEDPMDHPLLYNLGPEPLGDSFTPRHLRVACRNRRAAVKITIMDSKVVVGVGNIYASEALFRAGIRPGIAAGRVSGPRLDRLHQSIREVLSEAILQGGTTLRDFLGADGQPGYFRQQLFVYDRRDEPCRVCSSPIRHRVIGQRSTYWCPTCQK